MLTIGTLLPITNPFSTAPLFVSLTAGWDKAERDRQALRACIYAFAILAFFLLLGGAIIDFFGISVPGIRVAGGLIVSTIGFQMMFPDLRPLANGSSPGEPPDLDISFIPLAMPSLAGPGSISVVLTAAVQIKRIRPHDLGLTYAAVIVGMTLTLAICYVVLRMASSMVWFMGKSGIDAMTRIFGFLLICIGMQFLLTGIADFFQLGHA